MEFAKGRRDGWCFVYNKENLVIVSAQFRSGKAIEGHCGLQGRKLTVEELINFADKAAMPNCDPESLPSTIISPLGYHF